MAEIPGVASSVAPLAEEDLMADIWADPQHVDTAVLLDRLNTLLAIVQRQEDQIRRLEERADTPSVWRGWA
jgi:hypothetical protein